MASCKPNHLQSSSKLASFSRSEVFRDSSLAQASLLLGSYAGRKLFPGGFSRCGLWASSTASLEHLSETAMPRPWSKPTESEILGIRPRNLCFNKPSTLEGQVWKPQQLEKAVRLCTGKSHAGSLTSAPARSCAHNSEPNILQASLPSSQARTEYDIQSPQLTRCKCSTGKWHTYSCWIAISPTTVSSKKDIASLGHGWWPATQ